MFAVCLCFESLSRALSLLVSGRQQRGQHVKELLDQHSCRRPVLGLALPAGQNNRCQLRRAPGEGRGQSLFQAMLEISGYR